MELRRKTQREDRRRRVLREDGGSRADTAASGGRGESAIAGRTYTDAALAELQPRLTDFLPQRPFAVTVVGLLLLLIVAVPLGLDTLARTTLRHYPAHKTLLVSESGSWATWSSSLSLFAGAVISLLIFNIRRHKLDDYRGRYGVWVSCALLLAGASLDVSTNVHSLAAEGITELTGASLRSDGSLWWLVLLGTVSGVTGLRMFIDMRKSLAGSATLFIAAICYCTSTAMHWNWWSPVPVALNELTRATLLLLGHTFLLYALVLYARHVFLDAQGTLEAVGKKRRQKSNRWGWLMFWRGLGERLRQRRAAKKKAAAEAKKKAKSETVVVPADHDEGEESFEEETEDNTAQTHGDNFEQESDDEDLERLTDPGLPRSERRKLKKQQRRQQRQAA